jgi:hypothetical protein
VNVWAGLQVNWSVSLFGKDCDWTFVLGHAGAYGLPQLPPQTILQQDGALPHFCRHVRKHRTERWL